MGESLPTALERDTLLWPEVIAESVVQEASRYLHAELPADYPERLAAERSLVEANRELAARFEAKIQQSLAAVWGR